MPIKDMKEMMRRRQEYIDNINKTPEIWKPIRAFDIMRGRYQISNHGRIMDKNDKMRYPYLNNSGYCRINLYNTDGKQKNYGVHRIVAATFIDIPGNYIDDGYDMSKLHVNHIDGIKIHNAIFNLEWCTQKENTQHAHRTGLAWRLHGENNANNKFSDARIHQVCKYLEEGKDNKFIKEHTGVTDGTIYALVRNLYRKEITCQYNIKNRTRALSDDEIRAICTDIVIRKMGVYKVAEKHGVCADYVYALMKGEHRTDITSQYGDMSALLRKPLTLDQVYAICEDLKSGKMSYSAIAEKHGVSKPCVAGIRKGRLYPEITRNYPFT